MDKIRCSLADAVQKAFDYWKKNRKMRLQGFPDSLPDGCGLLKCSDGGPLQGGLLQDSENGNDLYLEFPFFSSNIGVHEDSTDMPDLERRFMADRLDLIAFLDSLGPNTPWRVKRSEVQCDFIVVPTKGIVITVPASLAYKYASVRFLLDGIPTNVAGLYTQIFNKVSDLMIASQKEEGTPQ